MNFERRARKGAGRLVANRPSRRVTLQLLLALLAAGIAAAPAASPPADVVTLVAPFSGHIAILPVPGAGGLQASPVGRTLLELGLGPHLTLLSAEQLADTNLFNAQRFPVAFHLGHEAYFQTITRAQDGDAALRQYLAGGGALFLMPYGPCPMYYNQAGQPVGGAAVVGLNLGAGGFEQPAPGMKLIFRANTNQSVLRWPEEVFAYPTAPDVDPRWRPSRAPGGTDARYTPLVTLWDGAGNSLGEGAVSLEFVQGPLRSGRVLFVWASLLAEDSTRARVVEDALRWALRDRPPPRQNQLRDDFEGRAQVAGGGVLWLLQAGTWTLDAGALVGQDCVADGYEIRGATRGNMEWRDCELTVRFQVESRGSDWRDGAWFGLHTRPNGDGYYLTFTDRDCQLHKVLYGISTREANALAVAPWKADRQWHTLHAVLRANRLDVDLDGQSLLRVKDDAHLNLPSMRHGAITLAARKSSASTGHTIVRFDDVSVQLLAR